MGVPKEELEKGAEQNFKKTHTIVKKFPHLIKKSTDLGSPKIQIR